MNIIFMGTPDFAVYTLEAIEESDHQILSIVTTPDKMQGRGKKILPSPIKKKALSLNYPILQPEKLNDAGFIKKIELLEPELIVVLAFKKLPVEVFSIPVFGTINAHASLLPKFRGAAPINHALLNGEEKTGITTFYINEDIDSGTILLQEECSISSDDNFGSLYKKLAIIAAKLVIKTLDQLDTEGIAFKVQNPENATNAPKITSEMRKINWNNHALNIHNHVRAFSPNPAAYTLLNEQKFKIMSTSYELSDINSSIPNGMIVDVTKKQFKVKVKGGYILPFRVQLQGKKEMDINSFLNGYKLNEGTILDTA